MKITVCELSNDSDRLERDWAGLVEHVKSNESDFVLLPEMPFSPWLARSKNVDASAWQESVARHDEWMQRLNELAPAVISGTRPVVQNGKRLNEGFLRGADFGYRAAHHKHYLPNEEYFWEASWYERGAKEFGVEALRNGVKAGFQICTEMWFGEHGREYMKQGVHLLLSPRATLGATVDKWIAGGRTAAVVSGAFCLSSNFGGMDKHGLNWAGAGWIIEPEEGEVLGVTSQEQPFLTVEIDLKVAENAKRTYPRYVRE